MCRRNKSYTVLSGRLCTPVITDHQLAFIGIEHAAMPSAGNESSAFKYGVFRRLSKGTERMISGGVTNSIIRANEIVAGIGYIILTFMFKDVRSFIPSAPCIRNAFSLPFLFGTKQKHRFSDYAGKIRL